MGEEVGGYREVHMLSKHVTFQRGKIALPCRGSFTAEAPLLATTLSPVKG